MRYRLLGAALVVLATALPARADDPAPQSPQAEAINDQGKELYKNKDYQGAAAKFREAIQIYPDARYYFNLCATLEKAGDYDGALEACDAVYDHQPGDELKGKTGQRAAVIRAAKRKRDQDAANNPNPPDPNDPNKPVEPPPPDDSVQMPAEESPDYRWEFGGEAGPLINSSLSKRFFKDGGAVLKLHASKQMLPKRHMGVQFYLHFGNVAERENAPELGIGELNMSVVDLGAAGYWNKRIAKGLYITPLIGVHLGLVQLTQDQAESFVLPGFRVETSFNYVIGGKHVLYFTPFSMYAYAPAVGQARGGLAADLADLDEGGVTFMVTFGYAYRTTKELIPGTITLE